MTSQSKESTSNNIVLLSFADKRYTQSLVRLRDNTEYFPFTQRIFMNEDDLSADFKKKLRYKTHRRGFGYWKWKPYVVSQVLKTLKYGDILVYTDGGTSWNDNALPRFNEYIQMLRDSDCGILAFQQPYLEKDYSKGDILDFLNVYNNEKITMGFQLWGGTFILKKTTESEKIMEIWLDLCCNHYDLITDKRSFKANLHGFIENRHDQSAFSLIVKKFPHIEISWKEVEILVQNDWNNMEQYPILGKRLITRETSLKKKVWHKIQLPYRIIIGLYLKTFEDMQFLTRWPKW